MSEEREIAIDQISLISTSPTDLAQATINPGPITEYTVKNFNDLRDTTDISSVSVVGARVFDPNIIKGIPIHSVDQVLFTNIPDIIAVSWQRVSQNPKGNNILKTCINAGGEYLVHNTREDGLRKTGMLIDEMQKQRDFLMLRMDIIQHGVDPKKAAELVKTYSNRVNKPFYVPIELKKLEPLNTLEQNLNAFSQVKEILSGTKAIPLISLDIRELQKLIGDNPEEFITNFIKDNSKSIGLIEGSASGHGLPWQSPIFGTTMNAVREQEKKSSPWGVPSQKISVVLEPHPELIKQLKKEYSANSDLFI